MTAAELSALSDQQLSERVAVDVAGWRFHKADPKQDWIALHYDCWIASREADRRGPTTMFSAVHPYAVSSDIVLPLCEKFSNFEIKKYSSSAEYSVRLRGVGARSHWYTIAVGRAPTLARACCLALLLAKGAA